ncbi:MAG: hypothetical protein JNL32_00135 [Candidatus Kapabacteria bacterium]|nr:hypothetical protein [Candidatus Kapabacteria bacterium]
MYSINQAVVYRGNNQPYRIVRQSGDGYIIADSTGRMYRAMSYELRGVKNEEPVQSLNDGLADGGMAFNWQGLLFGAAVGTVMSFSMTRSIDPLWVAGGAALGGVVLPSLYD